MYHIADVAQKAQPKRFPLRESDATACTRLLPDRGFDVIKIFLREFLQFFHILTILDSTSFNCSYSGLPRTDVTVLCIATK